MTPPAAVIACPAAISGEPVILPMKDRAAVIDRWLDARVETVLPMLMRRAGIDMWVIVSREYNEDPVIRTMLPSDWHAARRECEELGGWLACADDGGQREGGGDGGVVHGQIPVTFTP